MKPVNLWNWSDIIETACIIIGLVLIAVALFASGVVGHNIISECIDGWVKP